MLAPDHHSLAKGVGWGLLTAVCWAASTTLARVGISEGFTSTDLTLLRFTTSGVALLPFLLFGRPRPMANLGWGRVAALTATAGPAYGLLVAEGFRFAPLAHGAILFPVSTTLAAIGFGVVMLGEPFGWRGRVGAIVVVMGLILAMNRSAGVPATGHAWIGDIMFIAAGALFGFYSFLLRRWRIGALQAASVVAVFSMLICIFIAALAPVGGMASASITALAVQVAGQGLAAGVLATIAFSKAVHHLGSARAGLFAAIVPAVALLIGIPLLHEMPTAMQALGLGLMTAGLALTIFNRGAETKALTTPKDQ